MDDMDKEDDRKLSGDESEVVFSQQEKVAATLGSYGLTVDRQKENDWLEDTEPYNGARPRIMQERRPTIDVDQVVDIGLGATMGTTGQNMGFNDTPGPTLPPEQQIRQEGEFEHHHDGNRVEMEVNDRRNSGYLWVEQSWLLGVLRMKEWNQPVETGKVTSGHQ